jgi:murein DD-endopeptidase MepM/ murein hydrolase activator NlpD
LFSPSRYAFGVITFIFTFFSGNVFAVKDTLRVPSREDTLALCPSSKIIAASIPEMSEPELVLAMDSLFDADVHDPVLFSMIKSRIAELKDAQPKNQFGAFAFYPSDRFYGSWDTKHVFPYSDSLYKCETMTNIDLSAATGGDFTFPFIGVITSPYGWRDTAFHRGVDIDLNRGDTVRCAFPGMVRFAGKDGGYGNVVIVRHYNGLETVYAHLWKIKVKPGDIVNSGQLLGLGGSTGHSTGTHLHFETRFRGIAIDPAYFINYTSHTLNADRVCLVRTKQGYAVRPSGAEYHIVMRGDNYTKIAQHYGITVKELKEYNGWDGYVRLKAGMKVRVQSIK